jgi:3-demethoxyubiquinol 3-hydroxylase
MTIPAEIDTPIDVRQVAASVPDIVADLRSDHAGETGAVMIYRGILSVSRDRDLRAFATAHLATEANHLRLLDAMLARSERSALLPLWRIAGFLTGFLPALFGPRAVYATIDAVETFVDHHYEEQIRKLSDTGPGGDLRRVLLACQEDEVHHRDEARALTHRPPGLVLRAWIRAVGTGSRAAVAAARRI